MKIGYPCINHSVGCRGNHTFRLASYSPERLMETVGENLSCLGRMLEYNVAHRVFFFRITSDLVPFASHPVNTFDWAARFSDGFAQIGAYIRHNRVRINMHPDQFILINTPDEEVLERSVAELRYHCRVLDALGLGFDAKIQLHVGGVYGDRKASMERFIERYSRLEPELRKRLVVENDHVNYGYEDCLRVSGGCGIPVVLDVFHEEVLKDGYDVKKALELTGATWRKRDGLPFIDYSIQSGTGKKGAHAASIDPERFREFLAATRPLDFDIMLEIKDKETSALKAVQVASSDPRFYRPG